MMILQKQSAIKTLCLSNILENGLLNKYNSFLSYDDFTKSFKNDINNVNKLFNLFTNVIKNSSFDNVFNIENYIEDDNKKCYGRTCFSSLNSYTQSSIIELLKLVYYFQYTNDEKLNIFDNISSENENYKFIKEHGYDIKNKNDMNVLLQYFWKFEFIFKINTRKQ